MALEYKLPYTALEVDEKLGTVETNVKDIDDLQVKSTDLESDIKQINNNIIDIDNDIAVLNDNKVSKTISINGKPLSNNITLNASEVGADDRGSAAAVQSNLDAHANNSNIHFSIDEREKLAKIEANANKYVHPASGIVAGTYKSVKVDANGHVTEGENPTTLAGYGITDGETKGSADTAVTNHNKATNAHADIRNLITELTTRLNTLANSDDATLDQMQEVVDYIKNNKNLIDGITTSKVNVADIVNNLTTNTANKPLSAAQGVVLKSSVDTLNTKLSPISQILVSTAAPSASNVVENALYIRIIE